MTTAPPEHALWSTVEMLEYILHHLDPKTLLLSQRVSKTFRDTIANSLALQQKLFFKVAAPGKDPLADVDVFNTLLIKVPMPPPSARLFFPLNAEFTSLDDPRCPISVEYETFSARDAAAGRPQDLEVHLLEGVGRGDGQESWRRMYLFHRPKVVRCLDVFFPAARPRGRINREALSKRVKEAYITMGELVDKAFVAAKDSGNLKEA